MRRRVLLAGNVPHVLSCSVLLYIGDTPSNVCQAYANRGFHISFCPSKMFLVKGVLPGHFMKLMLQADSVHFDDVLMSDTRKTERDNYLRNFVQNAPCKCRLPTTMGVC